MAHLGLAERIDDTLAQEKTSSMSGPRYGSEWHLLRYLGYHRDELNAAVAKRIGCTAVGWRDFAFRKNRQKPDVEWKGIDFLPQDEPARRAWLEFWPQSGNGPNWDAVGRAFFNGKKEWLLVEAKGHVDELTTSCQAKEEGGLEQIRRAFDKTKRAMGVEGGDWLSPYYQYANRLAVLNFLNSHSVPARLLFIYFIGDCRPDGKDCPGSKDRWDERLQELNRHLGLRGASDTEARCHHLFLEVRPT